MAISDRSLCLYHGVKINPNERSRLSVRCGRFTINAGLWYIYCSPNRINY
nr:hypothetical protein [Lactiplantibacillus plantarum]